MTKRDSNVSLLFVGMLILITGVAASTIFSDNFAFADSDADKKEAEKALKALKEAKKALDETGSESEENIGEGEITEEEKEAREAAAKEMEEEEHEQEEADNAQEESDQTIKDAENALEQAQNSISGDEGMTGDVGTEAETETEETETEETEDAETKTERSRSSGGGGGYIPLYEEDTEIETEETETEETKTEETKTEETKTEETKTEETKTEETKTEETKTEETEIESPEIKTEKVKEEFIVSVDNVEDSSAGKMVYISGTGAESKKIRITIVSATDNQEIVELRIMTSRVGEFSTVWIKASDIDYESFTIIAEDRKDKAETTFTITEDGFVSGLIEDEAVNTDGSTSGDDGNIETPEVEVPNVDLEGRVSILEGLISVMQGILTTLTTAIESYQTQIDDEVVAREAADNSLQTQIDNYVNPQLVVYQRSIIITIPPGGQSYHTITCPDDDIAQSGGIEILTGDIPEFQTYVNHVEGISSWIVEASNMHESDSVDMTLYINCLKIEQPSESIPAVATIEPVIEEIESSEE